MNRVDQLTEINRRDLPLLRNLYEPDGSIAYTTIDTYIQWIQQDPHIEHLHFYCLNDDFSRGTFVVTDRCTRSAYASTLSENTDELFRLLLLIDYSEGYFFFCLNDHVASVVRDALKQKNVEIFPNDFYVLYRLRKENALELNIQSRDGIELKPMTGRRDIEKAYSMWSIRHLTSPKILERIAKYSPSVGAFLSDGTLVAWIFRFPTGVVLHLQTVENHYGHGYGSLVTRAISKQVAELGHDIYASISEENKPSRALFAKLGFEQVGRVTSICTKMNCGNKSE